MVARRDGGIAGGSGRGGWRGDSKDEGRSFLRALAIVLCPRATHSVGIWSGIDM